MVWSWPCLQAISCTIPGDHGAADWKVSQHQPKQEERAQQFSITPQTTVQRYSPWGLCCPCMSANHSQCHSDIWGRKTTSIKKGPEVGPGQQTCGHWLIPHRTAHSQSKGRWGPNLWSNSQEVCYTHTLVRKDNFPPFGILSQSF